MDHILPITKARQELTTLVENAKNKLNKYIITVKGRPAAVLMSAEEFESWSETVEIMSDPGLMKAIKDGEKEINKGSYITLEELKKELKL